MLAIYFADFHFQGISSPWIMSFVFCAASEERGLIIHWLQYMEKNVNNAKCNSFLFSPGQKYVCHMHFHLRGLYFYFNTNQIIHCYFSIIIYPSTSPLLANQNRQTSTVKVLNTLHHFFRQHPQTI